MKIPEQNLLRVCEILAMNGEIIATGRISEITEKQVKIVNSIGNMAVLEGNMLIKVLVHNQVNDGETFVALVYSSNADELIITNVEVLSNFEKREYFRVGMKLDTKCYIDEGSGELDEMNSFKVKVRDLSLRGAFIVTNAILEDNQRLFLVLPLAETEIFKCTLKRKVNYYNKSVGYGCCFEKYTNKQEDLLCQFIFEEQRKLILKAKKIDC
ncbi:MAG: PilZ domain-containing protein [Oscillospiraceae bacterium]